MFDEQKAALKKRYSDIYDDSIHDPIVEDLVETYNMIARFTEAINSDQETQTMIYLLRDARLHYRQLLSQLLLSFQSIKTSEMSQRSSVNTANALVVLSTQLSKLVELLKVLLDKLPADERDKYEKVMLGVLNGDSSGDFEITV